MTTGVKTIPPQATVPWLQFKGHWLAQAEFAIDTPVKIRVFGVNGGIIQHSYVP